MGSSVLPAPLTVILKVFENPDPPCGEMEICVGVVLGFFRDRVRAMAGSSFIVKLWRLYRRAGHARVRKEVY